MPNEITPDQLTRTEQQKAAAALKRKVHERNPGTGEVAAAQYTVDDALYRLQLALAGYKVDRATALKAIRQAHNWIRWLLYGNGGMHFNMLTLFAYRERNQVEREVGQITRELRLCDRAVESHREFRLEAIEKMRKYAKPLRVMSLALRQRDQRRQELRVAARREFANPNRAQALVNTVAAAIRIVDRERHWMIASHVRADRIVMLDLFAVIIGRNMLSGRLQGDYFAGIFNGSGGFKPELQDRHYQAQHALAGVWIGYEYSRAGKWGAMLLEWFGKEPQDVACYDVTGTVGQNLNGRNYHQLPASLARTIGDATVVPPR